MRRRLFAAVIVLLGMGCAPCVSAQGTETEREEPDFAFITGGPYTQAKNSIQFILGNTFSNTYAGGDTTRDITNALRTEWGITDRLEADLIFSHRHSWTNTGGVTAENNGLGDTVLGLRYRFLHEDRSPVTLTFGPQAIFPTGDEGKGFGAGGFGAAADLSLAREWNRWFFNYASLNYSITPGSSSRSALHNLTWAVAPVFRVLERDSSGGAHHDIHLFIEGSGTVSKAASTQSGYLIAPGIRYGYLTPKKTLAEIGICAPTGLNDNSPDWGIILQLQLERAF